MRDVLSCLLWCLPVALATSSMQIFEEITCTTNDSSSVFSCELNTQEPVCLSSLAVCNGIPECPGGQDEAVQHCGCLANEFRCSNSCVAQVKRCDLHRDCDNGEDELDCQSFLCPITHFKCSNHFCVPLHAHCDFKNDCGDNSDEIGCFRRQCWHLEFKCANGQCIRPMALCDGRDDCFDGSDEVDCGPESFRDCGDGTRVHRYQWCDGRPDCEFSHVDELNCHTCNTSTEFTCPNGRCIRQANLCDSQCDCAPHKSSLYCADELDCSQYYTISGGITLCHLGKTLSCASPQAFALGAVNERCIQPQFLCDGHNDCYNEDYSDEFGCEIPNDIRKQAKTFRCKDNRTLPEYLRCNFKYDCLHGDDEDHCPSPVCGEDMWQCVSRQCVPAEARCDLNLDCFDKSDELNCDEVQCQPDHVKCRMGGQCIHKNLWCDFFLDCPDGSDEGNCTTQQCGPQQWRCDSGQCVTASQRCYDNGNPRNGCADRSHLKNCRDWTCRKTDQFKCQGGPCINQSLVCNVNIDCNGSWNDEDGCPFVCSETTPQCECRDVHINCTDRQLTTIPTDTEKEITWFHLGSNRLNESLSNATFKDFARLLYLDLSNNSIRELPPFMFRNQWRLTVLDLHNNLLTLLGNGSFYGLASVKVLHLQGNRLKVLQAYAFYGLYSLISLDLQAQRIDRIEPEAFLGLHSLTGLDLSHNVISHLSHGTLRGMPALLFLNISENRIKVIEPNVFRSAPLLDKLVTDEFRFCCLARNTSSICLPPPDEFSSCEDLMSNLVLRLCVWLLAGVATVGNILVIVWRVRFSHCNQVHSFLITNLALGDLIMGFYLLMIAVVDSYYRGVYFIHDSAWRTSSLCALAGFLSTFSSELSIFTLTVITLDRFLVIIFPFRVRRLEMTRTRRLMVFGWLLAALVSALPLTHIPYFHNFYGRSGVCLALHITPDKPSGWEYSVFVFLVLNLVSFSIIALGYLWMFIAARTTQLAVARDRRSSESAMAWRMTLLVATDAACWVPIIGLGLASLAGFTVPPQVFAWVAVFVLPLNAAVNPVLYTLSTTPFLSQGRHGLLRFRHSCRLSRQNYSSSLPLRAYGCVDENAKSETSTCYSLIKRTSVRWHQKMDTVVCEHGEVVPLNHLTD